MKNVIEAENLNDFASFPEPVPGPIERHTDQTNSTSGEGVESKVLDSLLTAIKWIFLYLPGAAVIHLIMLGFALLYFYNDWSLGIVVASAGILIFGTFMMMLGIGKLTDLRYLRVAASLVAAGALAAILYSILIVFIPGDFFGPFARLSLPLTLAVGYMVKKDTDKKIEAARTNEDA